MFVRIEDHKILNLDSVSMAVHTETDGRIFTELHLIGHEKPMVLKGDAAMLVWRRLVLEISLSSPEMT